MTAKLSTVYVIANGAGLVKIGRTLNPDGRFKALSASSGESLSVIYLTTFRRDASVVEAIAHAELKPMRRHGEWFAVDERAAIQAVTDAIAEAEERQRQKADAKHCRIRVVMSADMAAMIEQAADMWPECSGRADVVRRLIVDGLRENDLTP